jgi:hypothetical protein
MGKVLGSIPSTAIKRERKKEKERKEGRKGLRKEGKERRKKGLVFYIFPNFLAILP